MAVPRTASLKSRPAAGTAAGACVHITQPGSTVPSHCAGAVAATALGLQQEQRGPHTPLPGLQIWLPEAQQLWVSPCQGREHRGGEVLDLVPPHLQGWWQQAARYMLAAKGEGMCRQLCWSSHHWVQLVSRRIWDTLMPCEDLDCQRAALTPVQHWTLSISEHLLPPGVPAQLRLVPRSCAFLPVSRFVQLHSLSPAARQH